VEQDPREKYSTWRLLPRSAAFDEFVQVVMKSWRSPGGEPNVGGDLSVWRGELGFEVVWEWLMAFVDVNGTRLRGPGFLNDGEGIAIRAEMGEIGQNPHAAWSRRPWSKSSPDA
jgi:hypothetical protein